MCPDKSKILGGGRNGGSTSLVTDTDDVVSHYPSMSIYSEKGRCCVSKDVLSGFHMDHLNFQAIHNHLPINFCLHCLISLMELLVIQNTKTFYLVLQMKNKCKCRRAMVMTSVAHGTNLTTFHNCITLFAWNIDVVEIPITYIVEMCIA